MFGREFAAAGQVAVAVEEALDGVGQIACGGEALFRHHRRRANTDGIEFVRYRGPSLSFLAPRIADHLPNRSELYSACVDGTITSPTMRLDAHGARRPSVRPSALGKIAIRVFVALMVLPAIGVGQVRAASGRIAAPVRIAAPLCDRLPAVVVRALFSAWHSLPPCGPLVEIEFISSLINGHAIQGVGYVDSRATAYDGGSGAAGFLHVDGTNYDPSSGSVAASIPPLGAMSSADAQTTLQAVLLGAGAFADIVTPADVAALRAWWPRAASVASRAPAFRAQGHGFVMSAWWTHRGGGHRRSCRWLYRRDASIDRDGRIVLEPRTEYPRGGSCESIENRRVVYPD